MKSFLLPLLLSILACSAQTPPNQKLDARVAAIRQLGIYDNKIVELEDYYPKKWKPKTYYYKQGRVKYNHSTYEVTADSTQAVPESRSPDWRLIEGPHPYLYLRDTATREELVSLLKSDHGYVKSYAFAALKHRKDKSLFDFILEKMADTTRFTTWFGRQFKSVCPADLMIRYSLKELLPAEKEKIASLIHTQYKHLETARRLLLLQSGKTAIFSADSTSLNSFSGRNTNHYNKVMEMEWRINGKTLRFDSAPIEVEIGTGEIDTLYYRDHLQAKWDTIIYALTEPKEYSFRYNECCGGFDVVSESGDDLKASVSYRLTKKSGNRLFLGTLGEVGTRVTPKPQTLKPECRSAMSPNVYWLTLEEVKRCSGKEDCNSLMCSKDDQIPNGFEYSVVSTAVSVLYMPLNTKTLEITLDVDVNKVTSKIK